MKWRRAGFIDQQVASGLPEWLHPLSRAVPDVQTDNLTRFVPTDGQGRSAAVLVLFGDGPDVLVIERARGPVAHSGQPAFPGGAHEESDVDTFATALREAREETGVDPAAIDVFGALPDLWVPVSDYVVSPVLGWWHSPHPVQVQDPSEVSRVQRVDLSALVDPANRYTVVHPSGYRGPGFAVHDLVIWGFTAGVLSGLLDLSGWQEPWDASREIAVSA
jgi:8-oxo-dGTP pyrophosphatase MutT (NUDIX family)